MTPGIGPHRKPAIRRRKNLCLLLAMWRIRSYVYIFFSYIIRFFWWLEIYKPNLSHHRFTQLNPTEGGVNCPLIELNVTNTSNPTHSRDTKLGLLAERVRLNRDKLKALY